MSYVVKAIVADVNALDQSEEAKQTRITNRNNAPGYQGLKPGLTSFFLFDTQENADSFASQLAANPESTLAGLVIEVITLESTGLSSSDFI